MSQPDGSLGFLHYVLPPPPRPGQSSRQSISAAGAGALGGPGLVRMQSAHAGPAV